LHDLSLYLRAQLLGDAAKRMGYKMNALGSLTVASAAGAVNVVITNPIWLIVTRMQTHSLGESEVRRYSESLIAAFSLSLNLICLSWL
jgi:hypothetical protein